MGFPKEMNSLLVEILTTSDLLSMKLKTAGVEKFMFQGPTSFSHSKPNQDSLKELAKSMATVPSLVTKPSNMDLLISQMVEESTSTSSVQPQKHLSKSSARMRLQPVLHTWVTHPKIKQILGIIQQQTK